MATSRESDASRDSHDLSLSPRDVTRDSLVNNMLLSLDQFSLGQKATGSDISSSYTFSHGPLSFDSAARACSNHHHQSNHYNGQYNDQQHQQEHQRTRPRQQEHLHHQQQQRQNSKQPLQSQELTHRYSCSSDLDAVEEYCPPPARIPRGRQVDGGSSFRIPSVDSYSSSSYSSSSHSTSKEAALPSRGRIGAKKTLDDIRTHQIDAIPPPGLSGYQYWGCSSTRRSQSLDQGSRLGLQQQLNSLLLSPFRVDFPGIFASDPNGDSKHHQPRHFDDARNRSDLDSEELQGACTDDNHYNHHISADDNHIDNHDDLNNDAYDDEDDYAAAPTPAVPSGPRRVPSAILLGPPPPEPFNFLRPERDRSTTRSVTSRSGRSRRVAHLQLIAPTMTLSDLDAAPSPSVSYGKSKAEQGFPSSPSTPPPPREKQGFFRRVFGSKSNATHAAETQLPQTGRHASASLQQVVSSSSNTRNMGTQSLRDVSSSHSNQPVLHKKPSSFFRRYNKKSNADDTPPLPSEMPLVPPLDGGMDLHRDQDYRKSPASSLRKVMIPYLRDGSDLMAAAAQAAYALADITNSASEYSMDNDDDDGESNNNNNNNNNGEYKRSFSPDYEPSINAKIRAVTSDSDHETSWCSAESPTMQRSSRANGHYEKRSRSFLDLGSGSDNGDYSPRPLGMGGREAGINSSPLAAAVAGRHRNRIDHDSTIRRNQRYHSARQDRMDGGQDYDDLDDEAVLAKPWIPSNRSTSMTSGSTETDYKTAPSAPPSVHLDMLSSPSPKMMMESQELARPSTFDEPDFTLGEPTEDDLLKAQQIYDGAEDFIAKEKAASWMGEEGSIRQRTLKAYIELFDFTDMSVVNALRKVCSRLILRAETQQVDRILVAFSRRWCECNPTHGFKATDVIHTICYSIMLLNTDLHVADIEQKMTRSQFVKNTLATIMQAVAESAPDAFERPSILPEKNSLLNGDNVRPSTEHDRRTFRNSFRPSARTDPAAGDVFDETGPLVKTPFYGTMKAWEEQMEMVLKLTYVSIKDDRLPLFGAEQDKHSNGAMLQPMQGVQGNLSVMGVLKRSPSVLSKAPSESFMSTRGRAAEGSRSSSSRWTSKNRSRVGLGRNGFSSSRTSFDDNSSLWSPTLSSATWSRYSLGRTHGSRSQDSLGSTLPRGDYQQSIGFANALSQAIIRDEDASGHDAMSVMSADMAFSGPILEDESLELSGPPWVKEGRVMHKHHLDGMGKRAKERNWTEVFAVVQKGQMSLFSFNASKSMRQKNRGRQAGKPSGPVGGGNWQDNAVNLGTFNLRLTLASALPSPGYSRTRPFVWALSLPTGAVHLFQVGTPEIIKEFVDTANYWSARLSSHPLVGGISNIEYGWSEGVVSSSLVSAMNESSGASIASGGRGSSRPSSSATHARKSSAQSGSFQGTASMDHGSSSILAGHGGLRGGKLAGDLMHISSWTPPTQSMRPSNLSEGEQLETLAGYVRGLEEELQVHNQLRSPMLLAFAPRGTNAGKAMANWERKSAYLLRETVKFRTYVDALQQAGGRRREIYKERELARKAARGELTDADMEFSGGEEGDEGDETLRPR